MTSEEKEKVVHPYTVQPWIEKNTGWYGTKEYLVGYQILYNGKLYYNLQGKNRDYADDLARYLNLAFVQGMRKMSEIQNQKLKDQLNSEQK